MALGPLRAGWKSSSCLLADLPADTGLAIVFIQHLDPNHHSMLAEILARATAMPVSEAADGMPVEANHVYVIPANVDLTIAHGRLKLAPRTQTPGSHMPIDRFLRSLAGECGSRAIGVILSGAGSDGSAGVEAVKAAGGVNFAQDAATAKFAGHAGSRRGHRLRGFRSAAGGHCPLNWSELAGTLILRMPCAPNRSKRRPTMKSSSAASWTILHGATGIDFSLYREKMIKRRILRRLALRNISGLVEYRELLEKDSDELEALQRDLLISVTSFFRDPGSVRMPEENCLSPHSPREARQTTPFASGWRVAPREKRHSRLRYRCRNT